MRSFKFESKVLFPCVFLLIFLFGCSLTTLPSTTVVPDDCSVEPETSFKSYIEPTSPNLTKHVYVLVDRTYRNSNYQSISSEIPTQVSNNLLPGDRLTVAWFDPSGSTDTIFFDEEIAKVTFPQFHDTPTPVPPPIKPTLTLGGPTTMQGQQMQTSEAVNAENILNEEKHNCAIGEYNATRERMYSDWSSEQEGKKIEIENNLRSEMEFLDDVKTDDTSNIDLDGPTIYKSLSLASNILQQSVDQKLYSLHILVIFSSLTTQDTAIPDDISIDLRGVDTYVVVEGCKYEFDCKTKEPWENKLVSLGATSIFFVDQLTEFNFESLDNCTPSVTTVAYENLVFSDEKREFFFVLVDKSNKYEAHVEEAFGLITNQIAHNLQPGDELAIAWIDLQATTDSVFFIEKAPVTPLPELYSPTDLPPPTGTDTTSGLTNEPFSDCMVEEWNRINHARYEEWKAEQQREINALTQRLDDALVYTGPEPGKLLYESLGLASTWIASKKEEHDFEKYSLIIFSDMYEWRDRKPGPVSIAFNDIDVYVVMQQCNYDIDCNRIEARWKGELDSFGTNQSFILSKEDILSAPLQFYLFDDL